MVDPDLWLSWGLGKRKKKRFSTGQTMNHGQFCTRFSTHSAVIIFYSCTIGSVWQCVPTFLDTWKVGLVNFQLCHHCPCSVTASWRYKPGDPGTIKEVIITCIIKMGPEALLTDPRFISVMYLKTTMNLRRIRRSQRQCLHQLEAKSSHGNAHILWERSKTNTRQAFQQPRVTV